MLYLFLPQWFDSPGWALAFSSSLFQASLLLARVSSVVRQSRYNLDFGSASDRSRLVSPYNRGDGGGEEYGEGMPGKGLQSSSDPNI
ncbi:hypothetical protein TNCV_923421 [Trichonephila clavipes]|nr:hypothetical protein TNCV_923421 [Trichonephila clavipes]